MTERRERRMEDGAEAYTGVSMHSVTHLLPRFSHPSLFIFLSPPPLPPPPLHLSPPSLPPSLPPSRPLSSQHSPTVPALCVRVSRSVRACARGRVGVCWFGLGSYTYNKAHDVCVRVRVLSFVSAPPQPVCEEEACAVSRFSHRVSLEVHSSSPALLKRDALTDHQSCVCPPLQLKGLRRVHNATARFLKCG